MITIEDTKTSHFWKQW